MSIIRESETDTRERPRVKNLLGGSGERSCKRMDERKEMTGSVCSAGEMAEGVALRLVRLRF